MYTIQTKVVLQYFYLLLDVIEQIKLQIHGAHLH